VFSCAKSTVILRATLVGMLLWFDNPLMYGQFPDAHNSPPPGWTGPIFKLRQDYPATPPSPETKPWKQFNFKTQPLEYVRSVLSYCREGNVEADWQLQNNHVRNWYHVPWLHTTSNGREFVHGLTLERSSRPNELAPTQTSTFSNWAVGMYNSAGGYVIGQVWKDPNAPDPSDVKFPDGTVACKLLFTTATVTEVPYLKNSFEWQAHVSSSGSTTRTIQTVRLLQVDVAIRDSRARTTTGWVFGTFVYDGNATGETPWDRLVPVGVMWGNDPRVTTPTATSTTHLKQTFVNSSVGPSQHLGRAGRLNGPVDNPKSSCLSCHSTAQYKAVSDVLPPANAGTTETMRWFRNIKAGKPFDTGQQSLDYSLQLSLSIQRFVAVHPPNAVSGIANRAEAVGQKVFPVRRDEEIQPQ
jgi:hypothetical protein